jgi:hypothetical protein
MKRYLCWLAVLGVVGVPAAAAACWPMWRSPAYGPRGYAPIYAPPPMYATPPVWQPAPVYVLPPPRVEPAPRVATPPPAPPETGAAAPSTTRPPVADVVRPAVGSDAAVPPTPAKKTDPPAVSQDPKFPVVEIPKNLQTDPKPRGPGAKLPPLELPKDPEFRAAPKSPAASKEPVAPAVPSPAPAPGDPMPKLPPLELPKDQKLPPIPGFSPAVPGPAPAPSDPLIPSPSVPLVPDPGKSDALPSLTLPPETPVKTDSTSRSSPLTGGTRGPTVSVFPASGTEKVTGVYRTVGFYNHTARDLTLTIEGRVVKLPAKTYLQAQLTPIFTWGYGDRPTARETVPDGAGGLDVVFRE